MSSFRPNCVFYLYRYPLVGTKIWSVYLKSIATVIYFLFDICFIAGMLEKEKCGIQLSFVTD